MVVAQAIHQLVSATTTQNLIIYAVPVTGLYRCSLYFYYSNGTPAKVTANVTYTDPDVGGVAVSYFMAMNSAAPGMILNGAQTATTGNNQGVACAPLMVYAQTSNFLSIAFRDPSGTPADRVSAFIGRLS